MGTIERTNDVGSRTYHGRRHDLITSARDFGWAFGQRYPNADIARYLEGILDEVERAVVEQFLAAKATR